MRDVDIEAAVTVLPRPARYSAVYLVATYDRSRASHQYRQNQLFPLRQRHLNFLIGQQGAITHIQAPVPVPKR